MIFQTLPKDLNETVHLLVEEVKKQEAEKYIEERGIPHHGIGTSLRNNLFLWWQEGHNYSEWPTEKPALVAWFNERNIYHADDMSATISAALQARIKGEEFDFDGHIKRYFTHWKKYGFKDGIFKPENKE
jgi:hypothetical protein